MTGSLFTPFRQALDFLTRSKDNGGIYGLQGSAPSFMIASALRSGSGTTVIIHTDGEKAAASASDIRFFHGDEEQSIYPLRDAIVSYPSSDFLPYSFAGYESDVWKERMAVFYRLAEGHLPRVMSVGLDALVRKIIPRSMFGRSISSLSVGQDLDRDELARQLVQAGYSRAPLVEDVGDFSLRGFIIDIYTPLYTYPIRIEQLGDVIESIRSFDPANQRSREQVAEIIIGPVNMFIADQTERQFGAERLLSICEERGVEKRVRQRLLDDLRQGIRFVGAEYYLPYLCSPLESLFDYIPHDSTIVLPDENTIGTAFEDFQEEISRGFQSAYDDGLPVPEPAELYLSRSDFLRRLKDFRVVVMSELEMEGGHRIGHRIKCDSNSDIRKDLLQSQTYDSGMAGLVKRLKEWRNDGNEVFMVSHTQGQAHRLLNLLEPYNLGLDFRGLGFELCNLDSDPTPGIRLYVGPLSSGFRMEEARLIILTEEEIFGTRVRAHTQKRAAGAFISSLTDLAEGDPVVHEDYGIGIFRGLAHKEFEGIPGEVMVIEYAGGDLLYQPVDRLHVIQKYISASEALPAIDRLGGKGWAKTKAKVKKAIREMANELLQIFAKRQIAKRKSYSPPDDTLAGFEASFEFEETPDQARAIQDVMESMDSDMPMDRLVCGDVGYGKTEVALRAAFRAIMDGKQVAVLVPTTVLAQQHYETFKRRFKSYPINVDVLSRFRTGTDQRQIIHNLNNGTLDLIVATHKLLNKDIAFRELGLLVVDEEHRFGVAHKERIKQYKAQVDVLTLTATPIPRTLNLSLTGIRDLSVIETPPTNRKSIRTHVMKQSDDVVREALSRELNRGGQAFYLHNRIETIFRRAASIKSLVPEARVAVAHGRMADRDLEKVMYEFVTGKLNVLVCTSIIGSGLDIPNANTIIIDRADTFGLADLYQLRGRVGRSNTRAYAYLLTPPETLMTQDAVKRMSVIQEHSSLGQGFRIAMRDMEIRGAGNILGTSQSGHVAQVGYEMYLDLLEQAVREIKGEPTASRIDPEIGLKLEARLPEDYVPDSRQRMNLYKRLSRATEHSELIEIEHEILDLYGKEPAQVSNLFHVMRIRFAMRQIRAVRLDYNGKDLVFTFDSDSPLSPEALVKWVQSDMKARLLPGDRLAYRIGDVNARDRIERCVDVLGVLSGTMVEGTSGLPTPPRIQRTHKNIKGIGLKNA
ncbi:MAG: transcription-repair coupling factor [Deltaproteobacteria bacterium]|nr:transcription-repair coupling factor [Deltaproteobacteria bacterium]